MRCGDIIVARNITLVVVYISRNFFPIAMTFVSRIPYVGEPIVAAVNAITAALAKVPGIGPNVQGMTQMLPVPT